MAAVSDAMLAAACNPIAPVAQWIERWTSNPKVAGSSPARGIFYNSQSPNGS